MAGLLPYLRLLRAGTLFSPGCDVVAGMCVLGMPWTIEAARIVAASVTLYAAGMVWNDVADRREDARQRPERPLPSGAIRLPVAVLLGLCLLALGLLLSPPDFRLHHTLIAAGVLAYDFLCKRVALAGAVTMGALRGLNLLTAGAPLWLTQEPAAGLPSALLIAALCYGIYIVAVTILGIYEDAPPRNPRAVVAVQTAPMLAAVAGLLTVQGSLWPAPTIALVPIVMLARRNRLITTWNQAAIRGSMLYLLLGTMLYTSLLCAAASCWLEAAIVAACIPVARRIARRISLT